MTLHITTITPSHIITVSDRLISTASESGTECLEVDNDLYKHLVISTWDASLTVCFAGFAGLVTSPRQTLDWLTKVLGSINESKMTIDKRLAKVAYAANDYIAQFRMQGYPENTLGLTILATGWVGTVEYGEVQYNYYISNCFGDYWTWAPEAKPKFTARYRHFGGHKFKDGYTITFLGNARLALKQRALLRVLGKYAKEENPKRIYECSVDIIKAAAPISNGTIGYNCSGTRDSKGDPGREIYDSRINVAHGVMPNIIFSR